MPSTSVAATLSTSIIRMEAPSTRAKRRNLAPSDAAETRICELLTTQDDLAGTGGHARRARARRAYSRTCQWVP
eukprot:CAMPEP_0206064124 /NCGR_PEP_ID=MMETSP1466-20131121/58574_1 /ASSEMBLY_ACC=CAM_ASM_001126 /TAXON_ID=44452 /ORGANISM="Pavlova gyrans, Strain CCMP608" /LENGTH=73 /DNA_ID=CAMNT_0053439497 /DNA_START=1234 /DNA_END=1451 /DNA_ORIENTATION=+